MKILTSPSVLACDFLHLADEIRRADASGSDWLHCDVMDGMFVPNMSFGFDTIRAINTVSDLPLDVHMMVNNPAQFVDMMNLGKDDYLCIHYEGDIHAQRTLAKIKDKGIKAGLALNPQTPVNCYEHLIDYLDMALVMTVSPGFAGQKIFAGAKEKVAKTRAFLDSLGRPDIPIEVDGNISPANGAMLSKVGAEIFVLGTSSLFIKDKDMKESAESFRAIL
jgi:ribulose-phosphate 3-epimerase